MLQSTSRQTRLRLRLKILDRFARFSFGTPEVVETFLDTALLRDGALPDRPDAEGRHSHDHVSLESDDILRLSIADILTIVPAAHWPSSVQEDPTTLGILPHCAVTITADHGDIAFPCRCTFPGCSLHFASTDDLLEHSKDHSASALPSSPQMPPFWRDILLWTQRLGRPPCTDRLLRLSQGQVLLDSPPSSSNESAAGIALSLQLVEPFFTHANDSSFPLAVFSGLEVTLPTRQPIEIPAEGFLGCDMSESDLTELWTELESDATPRTNTSFDISNDNDSEDSEEAV